jgi:hypothetical protein
MNDARQIRGFSGTEDRGGADRSSSFDAQRAVFVRVLRISPLGALRIELGVLRLEGVG